MSSWDKQLDLMQAITVAHWSCPSLRTKCLSRSQELPYCGPRCIHRFKNSHIAPPLRQRYFWQGNGKEDDDRRYYQPAVKSCGSNILRQSVSTYLKPFRLRRTYVVVRPPSVETMSNPVVEDQPDDGPGRKAQRRRWREPSHCTKHDRCVEES
jgi:hypothetical protein